MPDKKKIKYLMIVCPSHSGSTLLAMCLNCHTKISFFGEFSSINKRLEGIRKKERTVLCSFCRGECSFVDKKETGLLRICYGGRNKVIYWAKHLLAHPFYVKHFIKKSGKEIIGDSSKSADWAIRMQRLYGKIFDMKFIFLMRDGRAAINSYVRKNGMAQDLEAVINGWKKEIGKITQLKSRLKPGSHITVKYEELASVPDRVLKTICNFLGIGPEEAMLKYETYAHHIIGGNRGTRTKISIAQNQTVRTEEDNIKWYLEKGASFFLDERWKKEISPENLKKIEGMITKEQELIGYA